MAVRNLNVSTGNRRDFLRNLFLGSVVGTVWSVNHSKRRQETQGFSEALAGLDEEQKEAICKTSDDFDSMLLRVLATLNNSASPNFKNPLFERAQDLLEQSISKNGLRVSFTFRNLNGEIVGGHLPNNGIGDSVRRPFSIRKTQNWFEVDINNLSLHHIGIQMSTSTDERRLSIENKFKVILTHSIAALTSVICLKSHRENVSQGQTYEPVKPEIVERAAFLAGCIIFQNVNCNIGKPKYHDCHLRDHTLPPLPRQVMHFYDTFFTRQLDGTQPPSPDRQQVIQLTIQMIEKLGCNRERSMPVEEF